MVCEDRMTSGSNCPFLDPLEVSNSVLCNTKNNETVSKNVRFLPSLEID